MADGKVGPSAFTESGDQYSKVVGFVYIFNLIVGTGALTMPAAFQGAGWLLSAITIVLLSFMSYITLTFMVEAMAVSNAKLASSKSLTVDEKLGDSINTSSVAEVTVSYDNENDEQQPLLNSSGRHSDGGNQDNFEIRHRVEMGSMAFMFFNKVGMAFFHLCMIIYLYGDLAIYAAAVPKSLRDVACTYSDNSSSCNKTESDGEPCWSTNVPVTRMDAYRIFVAVFCVLLGPFVFFNVQKTKYLQILTSGARWIAFIAMIVLASITLAKGKGTGSPKVADISGVPNLFGVCVYSFMCHHSLPSLITPIRNKKRLLPVLAGDYTLILVFYVVLSFTGVFAFKNIQDLYTLNFAPRTCDPVTNVEFVEYFLALFPVFTLSTSFPIIAITLRNNLATILTTRNSSSNRIVVRFICPVLAILPPVAVAMGTNQVEFLVGITGSYAGAGIQYVIPAALVYCARRQPLAGGGGYMHQSPFTHIFWVVLVVLWAVICVAFVTVNHILVGK